MSATFPNRPPQSARLPRLRGLHSAAAYALERFAITPNVHEVVEQSGYSHRRFIALFRRAVGLTPKLYCRVVRFKQVLACIATDRSASFVDVALAAGYSDQAHFTREFQEFAGVTATAYREVSPV